MADNRCVPGFNKILLATDGSKFSEAATMEALEIAKGCSSTLYVLSVVEVNPEYQALAPQLVEKAEKEAKAYLESVKSRATQEGIVCETIIHQGEEPYKYIVDEAAKRQATVIIMGSHGRTGLKRLLMGSVTARVIGYAACKVLVVSC
ncbi:MAG: universal stress protein [Nitrospirota bacterium]